MEIVGNQIVAGIIKDEARARGISNRELALRMEMSLSELSRFLKGSPVTPEIADNLEQAFGISAGFWLDLQTQYVAREPVYGYDIPELTGKSAERFLQIAEENLARRGSVDFSKEFKDYLAIKDKRDKRRNSK